MDRLEGEFETPRQRWRQLWPFMFAYALGFVLAWLEPGGPENLRYMAIAGVIIVAVIVSILAGVWSRTSDIATLIPVAGACIAVDLMRAATGGSGSGYGSLLLIPVIWQAMRRRQLELNLTIALVSIANVIAVGWISSPLSPGAQWRSVILFAVVAATIGQTIFRLVQGRADLLVQISQLARLDPLTGIANRRSWDDRFPEEAERASRGGLPLAVAMIDLDHFKAFNDRFGHQRGDALLREAAMAWGSELRTGDLLARWGGEEFALLLPATGPDAAAGILERLQAVTPEGQTFSAGYAVEQFRPGFDLDLDSLMQEADRAMYAAKAAGRARAVRAPERDQVPSRPLDLPVAVRS
ncbi:GGDEF domain-containing protein [Aquihabitans daechungensis]|uniref:GGDEF domain-containing protein n=1 Tax=Aquihabitans daechungensis TaxID=1052257 RepID=UPI003B9E4E0E